jgi:hypothetical protein
MAKKSRAIVVNCRVDLHTGVTIMSEGYPKDFREEPAKGWKKGVEDAGVLDEDRHSDKKRRF